MASTLIDDFNRASLGSNWTSLFGTPAISGNQYGGGSTDNLAYYNVATYTSGRFGITIPVLPLDTQFAIIALAQDVGSVATTDGYTLRYTYSSGGADTLRIDRVDNAVATTIGGPWSQDLSAGGQIALDKTGTTLTAYYYNGSAWASLGTATDATYSGPFNIMLHANQSTVRMDDLVQITADAPRGLLLMGAG